MQASLEPTLRVGHRKFEKIGGQSQKRKEHVTFSDFHSAKGIQWKFLFLMYLAYAFKALRVSMFLDPVEK